MKEINYIEASPSRFDVGHLTTPVVTRPERDTTQPLPSDGVSVEFQKLSAGILVADSGPTGLVNAVRTKPEDLIQLETGSTESVDTRPSQPTPEPVQVATPPPGIRSQVERYTTEQPAPRVSVDA